MSTRLGKHYGGRFQYIVYEKGEGKWQYYGKYINYPEAAEDTGLSVTTISCLVNGIYTGYQDKWKIKTIIRAKKM